MFLLLLPLLILLVSSTDLCPLPCTECPASYYYNKGIQMNEEINFANDCTAKSPLDPSYERDFFLSNRSCEATSSICDGTLENPVDSFWKLVVKIFEEEKAQKYLKQRIRIFFIGSPHVILSNDALESAVGGLTLFRGFEGLVEFAPDFCKDNPCLDKNMVDVYVKTDVLQFAVSFELMIKNIRFLGNDLILLGLPNNLCSRSLTICCPSINDCSLDSTNKNFPDEKIDRKSLFVLRAGTEHQLPKILFANVHFVNFNSIREGGWRSLLMAVNSSTHIELYNFSVINSFFSHGVLLDVNLQNETAQNNNMIIMDTILIQNYNPYNIKDSSFSKLKAAFFGFENILGLSLSICNLTLQSIVLLNDQKYVFLVKNDFNFSQPKAYINQTKFDNTSGVGFITVDSSFEIHILDFLFKNSSIRNDNPLFMISNYSKLTLSHGLFSYSSFVNTSLFRSQQNSEVMLHSIYVRDALGSYLGNFSDGNISIMNSGFEFLEADFLLILFRSNLSIVNSSISSSLFKVTVFQLIDLVNLIYNQSWCTNVVTPNFFWVQLQERKNMNESRMMLYHIKVFQLKSSSIFLNVEDALIEFLSLRNFKLIDCSNFSLINLRAYFLVISLIDIWVDNVTFSLGLIVIEKSSIVNNLAYINMTGFSIQNCVFINNVFAFGTQNGVMSLQIEDFSFNNSNAYSLFEFQPSSEIDDNYKIRLNNLSLIHMKGDLSDPGLLFLVSSINSVIDSISLTNIIAENCTSISIINLIAKFNHISLHNISLSFIAENHCNLMFIIQLSDNYHLINNVNSSFLSIVNLRIKAIVIVIAVYYTAIIITYDFPLEIYFQNAYIERLTSRIFFFIISPPKKLVHLDISDIELYNIQPIFDDFFFIYGRTVSFSILSITNFYFHESNSFYLVYMLQMFDLVSFRNISIVGISYSLFYLILIGQYESKSATYSRVEFYNVSFVYLDLNNDYLSPISLVFLAVFDDLVMENVLIKNIRNYNHDIRGIMYFGNIQDIQVATMVKIRFEQEIWSSLNQVFRVTYIHDYFEVSDSKFQISSYENVRKFQCMFVYYAASIAFLNNELIGMSTIEKTQFLSEETGIVSFMTQDSYDFASTDNFFLLIKNNTFKSNFGIRYGTIGIVGFTFVQLTNNTFSENQAQYGGSLGVIAVRRFFIQNLIMNNSRSSKEGGGIYILRTNFFSIIDSTFYNISSNSDAGCLYAREIDNFSAHNVSIKLSSARDKGGVGYFINTISLTFINFFVEIAWAEYGGMFFFDEKTNVVINNSNFKSGRVSISGGFAFINGDNMNILIMKSFFNNFFSEQDAAFLSSPNILSLTITSSSIMSSMNLNGGQGIIYLEGHSFDNQEKFFNFINVEFYNTSALYGCNIYYTSNSQLKLINITSHSNQGSLFNFESESTGYIYIESSVFTGTNSIIPDLGVYSLLIFSKCVIYFNQTIFVNNFGMNHLFEINTDSKLTLMNSIFDDYFLIKKTSLLRLTSECKYFYIIKSEVKSINNNIGYRYNDMADSFKCTNSELRESRLMSYDDFYYNFTDQNAPIYFSSYKSNVYYDNIQMSNVSTMNNIFLITSSAFILNNTFIKLQSPFKINTNYYYFYIDGLDHENQKNTIKISNIMLETSNINLIHMRNIYRADISNSDFLANSSDSELIFAKALNLYNLYYLSILDAKFQKFYTDIGSCLYVTSDNTFLSNIIINNSKFQNNKALTAATIYIKGNISLTVYNSEFTKNDAIFDSSKDHKNAGKGSCIVIDSEDYYYSNFEIKNSKFISNHADLLGPTFLTKLVQKPIVDNCFFYDNKDDLNFTTTFSNFPLTILFHYGNYKEELSQDVEETINITIVSGKPFSIDLELYDDNNNIIFIDNDSQGDILCDSNQQPIFLDKASSKAKDGVINFENVLIISKPDSFIFCEILVSYTDSLIFVSSNDKIVPNKSNQTFTINLNIKIRKCIIGEIHQPDDSCYECPTGKYSLEDPQNFNLKQLKCRDCPPNAFCNGGSYITPKEGYWRSSFESILILECPSKSGCLGIPKGFEKLDEGGRLHGVCDVNYLGNMCFSCKKGYARYQQFGECLECDTLFVIYIKMTFSLLFIVGYICIQVNLFTKYKEDDSHSTVLIKIFLNHLNVFTLNRLLSSRVKIDIGTYFTVEDYFSFIYQDFIKIDCLIQDIDQDLFIQDAIFTILLPIIFSFVMGFIWMLTFCYLVVRKRIPKFSFRNLGHYLLQKSIITIIILIFLFYAEILKKCFSMLNCIEINEVQQSSVLLVSPNVYCWDANHGYWILTVSLPGLIVWGIIAPFVMMVVLFKNRDHIYKIVFEMEIQSKRKLSKSLKTQERNFKREIRIEIEPFLAQKLFFNGIPPPKSRIGYKIMKINYKIYQSVEILIKERGEILNNCSVSINSFQKIDTNTDNTDNLFLDKDYMVKDYNEILEFLENGFKPETTLTEENLRDHFFRVEIKNEEIYETKNSNTVSRTNQIIPKKNLNSKASNEKASFLVKNIRFILPGYTKDYFFWEIMILARKFILTLVCSFDQLFLNQIKYALVLVILLFFINMQVRVCPYHHDYMNNLEAISLITTFFNFAFLMGSLSETVRGYEAIVLIMFLINNSIFFIVLIDYSFKFGRLKQKMASFYKNIIRKIKGLKTLRINLSLNQKIKNKRIKK